MRIAYVISRYPAVSHTFVLREVQALRKLGWEVTTISIRRSAAKELLTATDREEAARTHVVVPAMPWVLLAAFFHPLLTRPGRFFAALRCAWRTRRVGVRGALWAWFYFFEALVVHRICRRAGIRHVHAHFANVASDVAMIGAALGGGTFSFTMHGPTEFFDVKEHRLAAKSRAAKFVICISDFARSQLMSMLPEEQWSKLHVVHCGVDPEQFDGVPIDRGHHRSGAIEILCVARLVRVKGHAVLFHAISELVMRGHDVVLTLAGDGPLRDELTKLAEVLGIQTRVRFLGNVGQDVIHRHFAAADLFVLPSFAEGVPVVLMEAMAARCPVIATRIAGIPELIEHGVTGLLVAPGRPDLLTDAIERVLLNPRAAGRMALAGHDKILREFNLARVGLQIAAIFKRVLEPRVGVAVDVRHRGEERKASEATERSDAREKVSERREVVG